MTIEEYIDILLENEIIMKGGSNQDLPYRFTDKGIQLIHDQFPNYLDSWYNAILIINNSLMFWGIEKGKINMIIEMYKNNIPIQTIANVAHLSVEETEKIINDNT